MQGPGCSPGVPRAWGPARVRDSSATSAPSEPANAHPSPSGASPCPPGETASLGSCPHTFSRPVTRAEPQHGWADTGGEGLQGSAGIYHRDREGGPVGRDSEGALRPPGAMMHPLCDC